MRSASSAFSRDFANSENWVCMASELGIHATGIEHSFGVHPLLQTAMQPQHGRLQGVKRKIHVTGGMAGGVTAYRLCRSAHFLDRRIAAQPALCSSPIH